VRRARNRGRQLAILVETLGSHALQAIGMVRALRRDEADLGQTAAQSIERRRALAGEQLARPMVHQRGLVLDRTIETNPHDSRQIPDRLAHGRLPFRWGFDNDHLGTLMPFGAPCTPSFAEGFASS
jgi:hypothetical protein